MLNSASLNYSTLRYANLSDAYFSEAGLLYADLSNANLSDATLNFAFLNYADLSHANLSNASLSYSNLSSTLLYSADLSETASWLWPHGPEPSTPSMPWTMPATPFPTRSFPPAWTKPGVTQQAWSPSPNPPQRCWSGLGCWGSVCGGG